MEKQSRIMYCLLIKRLSVQRFSTAFVCDNLCINLIYYTQSNSKGANSTFKILTLKLNRSMMQTTDFRVQVHPLTKLHFSICRIHFSTCQSAATWLQSINICWSFCNTWTYSTYSKCHSLFWVEINFLFSSQKLNGNSHSKYKFDIVCFKWDFIPHLKKTHTSFLFWRCQVLIKHSN